jgi:hypothetical protein
MFAASATANNPWTSVVRQRLGGRAPLLGPVLHRRAAAERQPL